MLPSRLELIGLGVRPLCFWRVGPWVDFHRQQKEEINFTLGKHHGFVDGLAACHRCWKNLFFLTLHLMIPGTVYRYLEFLSIWSAMLLGQRIQCVCVSESKIRGMNRLRSWQPLLWFDYFWGLGDLCVSFMSETCRLSFDGFHVADWKKTFQISRILSCDILSACKVFMGETCWSGTIIDDSPQDPRVRPF